MDTARELRQRKKPKSIVGGKRSDFHPFHEVAIRVARGGVGELVLDLHGGRHGEDGRVLVDLLVCEVGVGVSGREGGEPSGRRGGEPSELSR